jgi:asparagine synthase (glutamine-hydrolysing)
LEAAREGVRERLKIAVRKRLVADVPLGVLLSGGIDSSAIAALAARELPGRVKTFTVGFEDAALYDERPYAERVARHIGADHHSSIVKADAAELLPALVAHHGEPFGDSSAIATYVVAREARREVTVVLNGDGGDEGFAGYDRFGAALIAESMPDLLRRALGSLGAALPEGAEHLGSARRLHHFLSGVSLPLPERYFAWCAIFDQRRLPRFLLNPAAIQPVLSRYKEEFASCGRGSLLSQLLCVNTRTYLLDDLLPKMDRMTMASALEARSPLLDKELLEFAAQLPDPFKRAGHRAKIVLKDAVEDLLPTEILSRRKHGFGVPVGRWMRGPLKPMLRDLLLDHPRLGTWIRVDEVRAMVADHIDSRADHGHRLWALLTLEQWLRQHRIG